MPRNRSRGPKTHKFMNKLLLNQWLISLFGIDPFKKISLKELTYYDKSNNR